MSRRVIKEDTSLFAHNAPDLDFIKTIRDPVGNHANHCSNRLCLATGLTNLHVIVPTKETVLPRSTKYDWDQYPGRRRASILQSSLGRFSTRFMGVGGHFSRKYIKFLNLQRERLIGFPLAKSGIKHQRTFTALYHF